MLTSPALPASSRSSPAVLSENATSNADFASVPRNVPIAAIREAWIGRVQPQIGPLACQRTVEERVHTLIDVLAQLGDLRLADPAQTHRLNQIVDPPRETPPIQASWITAISAWAPHARLPHLECPSCNRSK